MARAADNNEDINRLNKTSYYVRAADFARSRLLLFRRVSHTLPPLNAIVPYLKEVGFGDTVPFRDFTFDNALTTHSWSDDIWRRTRFISHGMEMWQLVEQLLGARPSMAPQQAAQRNESFMLKLVWLQDFKQLGPPPIAPTSSGLWAVSDVILGLDRAGLDVLVTMLDSTPRCHGHCWLHSAVDVLDIPEIFSVVSIGVSDLHVSYVSDLLDCSSRAEISMRPRYCIREFRSTGYDLTRYLSGEDVLEDLRLVELPLTYSPLSAS
ncbi:uncharacterized protein DS421_8g241160 [Arachis hypogaea]|nr:uncharacterized protein DS421_8g241160 [Arachis hypogaea]